MFLIQILLMSFLKNVNSEQKIIKLIMHWLPPNTTSVLPLCDAGIIKQRWIYDFEISFCRKEKIKKSCLKILKIYSN